MATDFCYGQSRRSSAGALHRGSELDRPVEKMITAPGTKLGSYEIRYRRGRKGRSLSCQGSASGARSRHQGCRRSIAQKWGRFYSENRSQSLVRLRNSIIIGICKTGCLFLLYFPPNRCKYIQTDAGGVCSRLHDKCFRNKALKVKCSEMNNLRQGGDLTLKSWAPQGACGFDSHPRHSPMPRRKMVCGHPTYSKISQKYAQNGMAVSQTVAVLDIAHSSADRGASGCFPKSPIRIPHR